MTLAALALVGTLGFAGSAAAQSQGATQAQRNYVANMTEEQIREKLKGEGFSEVLEVKKVPVTTYTWTATAIQNGEKKSVTINERGLVSVK
jgi:hypothetical protein